MKNFAAWALGAMLTAGTGESAAQEPAAADSSATTAGSTVLLPILGYTPDTDLLFGGTVLRFFQLEPDCADARPSVFSPVFIYTSKSQIMIFLGTGLNWDRNRNALNVTPRYVNFPDQFYGTGRDVDPDVDEDYTSEQLGLEIDYNRRVWRDWRVGLGHRLLKHRLADLDPDGLLAGGTIDGTENTWLSALGPTLALDSRDNLWAPYDGWFLQALARFGGTDLGGDHTYQEYTVDLRGYRTVGTDVVLAGQVLTTRLDGTPPFFILPRLGGASGLRGYRGSLYMDRTLALSRVELRRSHLWGRLGAVVFAGIGDIASSPAQLTLARELWSAGFGFRFMLDPQERVNVRMDFGFGNGDSGFFLSLGEAF